MAMEGKVTATKGKTVSRKTSDPRSLPVSERGIRTGKDFAHLMSALMSDIISGRVTPAVGKRQSRASRSWLRLISISLTTESKDER